MPDTTDGTWTTDQLRDEFVVKGFAAGYVVVTRKSDGVVGSLRFTTGYDHPRIYFDWQPDTTD